MRIGHGPELLLLLRRRCLLLEQCQQQDNPATNLHAACPDQRRFQTRRLTPMPKHAACHLGDAVLRTGSTACCNVSQVGARAPSATLRAREVRQAIQRHISALLCRQAASECFDKCIGTPGRTLSSRERECVRNCALRYKDTQSFVTRYLVRRGEQEQASAGGSIY